MSWYQLGALQTELVELRTKLERAEQQIRELKAAAARNGKDSYDEQWPFEVEAGDP